MFQITESDGAAIMPVFVQPDTRPLYDVGNTGFTGIGTDPEHPIINQYTERFLSAEQLAAARAADSRVGSNPAIGAAPQISPPLLIIGIGLLALLILE